MIVDAIAHRPQAFTVSLALLVTSILLIYNGLIDVPESPRADAEPVAIACVIAGVLGLPVAAWVWFGNVNDPAALEATMALGLVAALGVTVWAEYRWPNIAGTLGYAMLILLCAGGLLRNELVLAAFLVVGLTGWLLAVGNAPPSVDIPPDNRTLIVASAVIAVAFHVALRFERHVQANLTRQLVDRIHNDQLTGVLSRAGMLERLEAGPSERAPSWCLYADVDYFKAINDRYGHDRGDEVLTAVAAALTALPLPDLRVARWGGDEFVVVGGGEPPDEDGIESTVNRRLEATPPGPRLTIGVIALPADRVGSADGDLTGLVDELVTLADRRMYDRRNRARAGRALPPSRNH